MTIEKFNEIQAAMPTPELIEKATAWIGIMNQVGISPDLAKAVSANDPGAIFSELCCRLEYLHRRCDAAEHCIEMSPCDPDITSDQIEAHKKWEALKSETP